MVVLVILLSVACLHYVEGATNIALNQPSWHSADHYTPPEGVSSLSFDGNTNPVFTDGSCSHTAKVANPWIAVDLGHSRLVYRVDITNRALAYDRFKMVRIGTTNQSPETVAPDLTNFEICHSYNPYLGSGVTQGFYCGSTGRYLVIQLQQSSQFLNICEVQVFEERFVQYMVPHAAKRITGHSLSLIHNVRNTICGHYCITHPACSSFNYQPTLKTCELVSSTFDEETAALVDDDDWTWYGRKSLYWG